MSNTMTAHEPIKYLDSILNEEEKRCEYSHQWRNFTISRSGRFKSKNKKRDVVDGKLFDASSNSTTSASMTTTTGPPTTTTTSKEATINNSRMNEKPEWYNSYQNVPSSKTKHQASMSTNINPSSFHAGKTDSYKNFYETNL